jgi:molecular chaperone DnaK
VKNDDVEAIKKGIESLTQASHKLAEIMYSQASQQQQGGGPEAGAAGPDEGKKDDDVVDADFEEVK